MKSISQRTSGMAVLIVSIVSLLWIGMVSAQTLETGEGEVSVPRFGEQASAFGNARSPAARKRVPPQRRAGLEIYPGFSQAASNQPYRHSGTDYYREMLLPGSNRTPNTMTNPTSQGMRNVGTPRQNLVSGYESYFNATTRQGVSRYNAPQWMGAYGNPNPYGTGSFSPSMGYSYSIGAGNRGYSGPNYSSGSQSYLGNLFRPETIPNLGTGN